MKNNIISESEKLRILNLHESFKHNLIGSKVISESEKIVTNADKSWDYKESNGKYYARKKGGTQWVLATGNAENAIKKLIFNQKVKTLVSPFNNSNQSNLFRQFVIKRYPDIAKKHSLDLTGPYNNNNVINTANEIVSSKSYGKIKLSDLFFKLYDTAKQKSEEPGQTLPSLVNTGFKIDRSSFDKDLGYYVRKCTQIGCAEFTYDMIGNVFGDAWQAYSKFQKYANVTPDLVKKMTEVFNSINKLGMPTLNTDSTNDSKAKNIIKSLIPSNQKQFNNLPLGSVVGLFYPDSTNFDLAFFQSAIGMSRDNNGKWVQIKSPYFCKQQTKCDDTLWKQNDANKNIKFSPDDKLTNGKSFIPNTHIGFIGYIDNKGERYVVHQVHQKVYAYPVSKMNKDGLAIIWAGTPKIK